MKQPLQPKTQHPIAQICLDLKEMGYDPIPLPEGKFPPYRGYVTMTNTEAEIKTWTGKTAAIRMAGCPDLVCIDLDIKNAILVNKVLARWYDVCPQFMDACLRRNSGGASLALFGRAKLDFAYASSNHWVLPGGADDDGHRVEIFTPLLKARYIAVWGVHTKGTDRKYRFEDAAMWEMKLTDLPELTRDDLYKMLDVVDAVMAEEGLQQSATRQLRKGGTQTAYDLKPDMMLRLSDETMVRLGDITQDCRAYANLFDDHVTRGDRVIVSILADGALQLWDSHTDINHYFERVVPEGLAEGLKKLATEQLTAAATAAPFFNAGVTLNDFYAYMPGHQYIFTPLGSLWPAASINGRFLKVPTGPNRKPMKPSVWLDVFKPCEQMIWVPGLPQIVENRLLSDGGWVDKEKANAFNTYRPPSRKPGNAQNAERWLDLIRRIYPDDTPHIVGWMAHRVQRPFEKINHALVLVGSPGIGKDTLIEPLRRAVGEWNFREISPHDVMSKWNDYMAATVVRISEARDLGDINRYALYEKMKTMLAAPPDTLRIEAKYRAHDYVVNVAGVLITTNHAFDGLYLPPDDRRHYVAGTDITAPEVGDAQFWNAFYAWYDSGGIDDVIEYLHNFDLTGAGFDAKTPPEQTAAFRTMMGVGIAPEVAELGDLLAALGDPAITSLKQLRTHTGRRHELRQWLDDRKNRRTLPHRMQSCGYVPVVNPSRDDGLWIVGSERQVLYGRADMPLQQRIDSTRNFIKTQEKTISDANDKIRKMKPPGGDDSDGSDFPPSPEK